MGNNEFKEDDQITEILAQFNRVKTSEEKEKYRKEILSKGFLPINDEFNETMNSSMEVVEKNPRTFIIEECIPACKELWKKTFIHLWLVII